MTKTRVLVADGLPIFGTGVSDLLLRTGTFDVAQAATLDAAARQVEIARPEIALIDLDLPPTGGVAAVIHLAAIDPEVRTIVWSVDPPRHVVLSAIRAGASGYLDKRVSPAGLVRTLDGIKRGEAPLSRNLAQMVIDALHGVDEQEHEPDHVDGLSDRELEVLAMVACGSRNSEIADVLDIPEFTVKRHVQNILQKLGASYAYEGANV